MNRLLLLIPSSTYRASDFLKAAEKLGVEVIAACNKQQTLEALVPGKLLTLDFSDLGGATRKAVRFSKRFPFKAVVSTEEDGTVLAAMISAALSLPHNKVDASAAAKNKEVLRKQLIAAGVPTPPSRVFSTDESPETLAGRVAFPVVLKPTFLSASRGVIRANNPDEFCKAFRRIKALLQDPSVKQQGQGQGQGQNAAKKILVEAYIPGVEVALEGLLQNGRFSCLALFDKPDPLEGPFFEETLYLTPSRLSEATQSAVLHCVQSATEALGLSEGPIHAEIRINDKSPWIIEIATRSIGGLCARTLRFGAGVSLEEIIIGHAIGIPIESLKRQAQAAGVMMIRIPSEGILKEVQGVDEARAVAGIEAVTITMLRGQHVVPLPEGRRYLGFIFARGEKVNTVETALRRAHQRLKCIIAPGPES